MSCWRPFRTVILNGARLTLRSAKPYSGVPHGLQLRIAVTFLLQAPLVFQVLPCPEPLEEHSKAVRRARKRLIVSCQAVELVLFSDPQRNVQHRTVDGSKRRWEAEAFPRPSDPTKPGRVRSQLLKLSDRLTLATAPGLGHRGSPRKTTSMPFRVSVASLFTSNSVKNRPVPTADKARQQNSRTVQHRGLPRRWRRQGCSHGLRK